jgi:hypothetical protein
MSLSLETPARPILSRVIHATPVVGALVRDVGRDINLIFYVLTIFVTAVVLAVQVWGLAALVVTALALVPVMFAWFIVISLP